MGQEMRRQARDTGGGGQEGMRAPVRADGGRRPPRRRPGSDDAVMGRVDLRCRAGRGRSCRRWRRCGRGPEVHQSAPATQPDRWSHRAGAPAMHACQAGSRRASRDWARPVAPPGRSGSRSLAQQPRRDQPPSECPTRCTGRASLAIRSRTSSSDCAICWRVEA